MGGDDVGRCPLCGAAWQPGVSRWSWHPALSCWLLRGILLPALIAEDSRNVRWMDAKLSCNCSLRQAAGKGTNSPCHRQGFLCPGTSPHVLGKCYRFKMRRIYTKTIPAKVIHNETIRYRSNKPHVKYTMGVDQTPLESHFAIPIATNGSLPYPAACIIHDVHRPIITRIPMLLYVFSGDSPVVFDHSGLTTATSAQLNELQARSGRIGVHLNLHSSGAIPPAGNNSAGVSLRSNYSKFRIVTP